MCTGPRQPAERAVQSSSPNRGADILDIASRRAWPIGARRRTVSEPNCPVLYSGVEMGLDLDSRVALVGANGTGKTTLLKLITGDLVPVAGNVRPHSKLRIARFSQHFVDVLDLTQSPLEYFRSLFQTKSVEDVRSYLGRYGITGEVQTQIMGQLSDGQKSRVVAKEIWLVENQSIKVYQGEISDFKMRVRKQLKLADKEPVKVADE
ncbi:hypothetical protein ON010_g2128 [Phytophthora cinnamomi]|nr:hypothetical protein ON010_g2128 [Phytophthora cinnamomi]